MYGMVTGILVTWLLTIALPRSMHFISMGKSDMYDPDGRYGDVLPSSLTVRGIGGHLCKECEQTLSDIQEESKAVQEELDNCLNESLKRDEEDFLVESEPEEKLDVFVGIQTGYTADRDRGSDYDYEIRRKTIRETWFKSGDAKLKALLDKHKIAAKFIIGHHPHSKLENDKITKENELHQDMLQIDIQEDYSNLVEKSREFFRVALEKYLPSYIIKVDDDVYVKLNRLPSMVSQWKDDVIDYTGCMKTGPIQADKHYKWYEKEHALLGDNTYFAHTWGSMYVLSQRAVRAMLQITKSNLRYLANEDVTIGMWMLALKMKHFDDRRMCQASCGISGVGLIDLPNPGLKPVVERMKQLHESKECMQDEMDFDLNIPRVLPAIQFSYS